MKTNFNEIRESEFQKLEFILPVVKRVHGNSHPEIFEVGKVFDEINSKTAEADKGTLLLNNEFEQLRNITNNYTVPSGACESYSAVYKSLKKVDNAYSQ